MFVIIPSRRDIEKLKARMKDKDARLQKNTLAIWEFALVIIWFFLAIFATIAIPLLIALIGHQKVLVVSGLVFFALLLMAGLILSIIGYKRSKTPEFDGDGGQVSEAGIIISGIYILVIVLAVVIAAYESNDADVAISGVRPETSSQNID